MSTTTLETTDSLLTAREAARLLACSHKTVLRMAENGTLPYWRVGNGTHLFDREDVRRVARERLAEARALVEALGWAEADE